MVPVPHGRPPGAPRKAGQTQVHLEARQERTSTSSSSTGGDQSNASIIGMYPPGESSSNGLFTMPRLPSDRDTQGRREVRGHAGDLRSGPSAWLSRRPPGQHDHESNSSAFIDTPGMNNPQRPGQLAQTAAQMATPSLGRPSTSRLYQDLTRGIAISRRDRANSRISAASSGWGSPKFNLGQGGRHIAAGPAADSGLAFGSATPGPSRHPQRVPNGVFDTPRTPSGDYNTPAASHPVDSLPHGMNGSVPHNATNIDGSLSVVRDEEYANNSGLLGMSPGIRHLNGMSMTRVNGRAGPRSQVSPSQQQNGKKASQVSPGSSGLQGSQSIIEHSALHESSGETGEMEAMRATLLQTDDWDQPLSDDRSALLDLMRNWREDAMKHHLYDTAIFWGDKILNLETQQIAWNDAYNLATAYFLTHRYAQAEQLLCTPLRLAKKRPSSMDEEEIALETEDGDGEEDWDELDAALAATRQASSLPASMLAKVDGMDRQPQDVALTERKRKERHFTISGTGTGSEGTCGGASGESASNNEDGIGNAQIGNASESDPVMQAWKEEQKVAMDEVRERDLPPPDSVSLVSISIPCKYLAAQCMVRQGKYQEALDELSGWRNESLQELGRNYKQPSKDGLIKLTSSIWHLKGLIHLRLRSIDEAKEDFIKSLSLDVKNYDSFDQLIRGNLLNSSEQWSLIEGLEFVSQSGDNQVQVEALQLLRLLYITRLDKTGKMHAQQAAAARRQLIRVYGLENNADVLLGLAEEMFARMKYEDAYTVSKRIMEVSKDHEAALPIYISTMYMIERLRPTLFLIAHHLTDTDPDLPAAWYAVGCWYLGTKQWLEARKYFSKCVQMDPRFAPGWVAFAHTFSYEGESDQAIVSYSTAERLFSSNHLIKLFVGMEHLNQANLTLADIFLQGSAAVWEEDALSRNERGVVQYYKGNYDEAIDLFEGALQAAKDVQQPQVCWSTTYLNLGFAYRRVKKMEQAMKSFSQAIDLDPDSSAAHTGLAMCYHREGRLTEAINWYHRALAINTSDKQTSELLSLALGESAKSLDIFADEPLIQESANSNDASLTPLDFSKKEDWLDQSANYTAGTVTMDEDMSQSGEIDESL